MVNIKCSVEGCIDLTSRRFRYPNPSIYPETFALWKNIISNPKFADYEPMKYYTHLRVCLRHFEDNCFSPGTNRLNRNAIPTLFVKRSVIVVEADNYVDSSDDDYMEDKMDKTQKEIQYHDNNSKLTEAHISNTSKRKITEESETTAPTFRLLNDELCKARHKDNNDDIIYITVNTESVKNSAFDEESISPPGNKIKRLSSETDPVQEIIKLQRESLEMEKRVVSLLENIKSNQSKILNILKQNNINF